MADIIEEISEDLLEACKGLMIHRRHGRKKENVRRDFHLMVAEEAARKALARVGVKA